MVYTVWTRWLVVSPLCCHWSALEPQGRAASLCCWLWRGVTGWSHDHPGDYQPVVSTSNLKTKWKNKEVLAWDHADVKPWMATLGQTPSIIYWEQEPMGPVNFPASDKHSPRASKCFLKNSCSEVCELLFNCTQKTSCLSLGLW